MKETFDWHCSISIVHVKTIGIVNVTFCFAETLSRRRFPARLFNVVRAVCTAAYVETAAVKEGAQPVVDGTGVSTSSGSGIITSGWKLECRDAARQDAGSHVLVARFQNYHTFIFAFSTSFEFSNVVSVWIKRGSVLHPVSSVYRVTWLKGASVDCSYRYRHSWWQDSNYLLEEERQSGYFQNSLSVFSIAEYVYSCQNNPDNVTLLCDHDHSICSV